MGDITEFQEPYRWASNFGPGAVIIGGRRYPQREHAYQAMKTADPVQQAWFTEPDLTAGQAKRLGQRVTLLPEWETVKKRAMLRVVLAAFVQNKDLAALLAATGDVHMAEGNSWHDWFWGVCLDERPGPHPRGCPGYGTGFNYLGRILMAVRDVLRPD
jgi:ribA/ribD-fused uncharacterized protein